MTTRFEDHMLAGDHASRPAATAVPAGSLYSCSTHSLIYKSDGATWSTWATFTSTGLSDPMTTRGDMIYRNASNVSDRLALPAAGQVIGRSGSDLGAIYPPGHEFDYVAFTAPVSVTATADPATTIVTANAVSYDGSTPIIIEFGCPYVDTPANTGDLTMLKLYDGSTEGQYIARWQTPAAAMMRTPCYARIRITPSNGSHTYSIRGVVTNAGRPATVGAGAGTTTTATPGYIRQIKA